MMRQLIGIFDEHTSRENGKNVRRAMRENAEQGFWNGTTPPLGYRTIEAARRGQKIKKRIEVDPVEAEVVKLIFDLYRNGEPGRETLGVKEVVKVLNRRGHRTRRGSLFGVGPTYNILTARYYATGRYPYGVIDTKTGKTNPPDSVAHIPIPTLISEDVFDAVQAKLRARNPRETPPRVVNGPCLLTGIVHCASCGAGMTRTGTVRGNRRYSYYTCRSNHQKGEMACKGRHVPMEKLDDIVLTALKERLLAPDRLRALLERLIDRRAKQTAEVSDRLECLRAEVADTTNRLRRLYALVEDGTAEVDDVLRHRIQVLRAEQARADAALGLASAQSNGGGKIDDGKIERFGQLMREKLDGGDVNARRAYIASVVSGIEVDDDIVRINGKRSLEPTLRSGAC